MEVTNLTADASVFTANAYYVDGEHPTLVDVGAVPGIHEQIPELDVVALTHQHGDHIAELDAVVDRFSPAVLAYADHPHRTAALTDGDTVQIGDDTYAVVHTPGHAADHVSFLSSQALFSGDVVVYNDGAFADGSFGRTDQPGQSREALISSLERLLNRLEPTVTHLYAGHGDPYHGDVEIVIRRALERAQRREPKYQD